MGTMTFQLPTAIPADTARELKRLCMTGGPDNMPWPSELRFSAGQLHIRRPVDESGYLIVPWTIDGRGQLMSASATLIERDRPYNLLVELARGKVNQVRSQAFNWCSAGLELTPALEQLLYDANRAFGRAVTGASAEEASQQAQIA